MNVSVCQPASGRDSNPRGTRPPAAVRASFSARPAARFLAAFCFLVPPITLRYRGDCASHFDEIADIIDYSKNNL
ncbi:hypothetical protein WHX56_11500 [Achromobacter veterisilvae]|uniref:Uncharacterized protein n=1 Tax=Achromobacter veterisilvae TaxID=2069367 RepID=A0ABZ2S895_9BURK